MTFFLVLPFAAAALSLLLGIAGVLRKKPSTAAWCFFAGMAVFSLDSLCTGLSLRATNWPDALRLLTAGLVVKSLAPAAWLAFSLTYSRGDHRALLRRWRVPLALAAGVPLALSLGFRDGLLDVTPVAPGSDFLMIHAGTPARTLNIVLLVAFAAALMNLEQTFRAAVGTMRWRVKYVVLGLAVVFGAQIFVRSQSVLFSSHDVPLSTVESGGLLIGGLLLVVGYARTGFSEADVYPSRAVLRSSLTVLVVESTFPVASCRTSPGASANGSLTPGVRILSASPGLALL